MDTTDMLGKLAVCGSCPPLGRLTNPLLDSLDALLAVDVIAGAACMAMHLSTTSSSSWVMTDIAVSTDSVTKACITCNATIPRSAADSCPGASSGLVSIKQIVTLNRQATLGFTLAWLTAAPCLLISLAHQYSHASCSFCATRCCRTLCH